LPVWVRAGVEGQEKALRRRTELVDWWDIAA